MRVLVNALSVTNASGRHVLLGHLARLAEWTRGRHEYVVLHHAANEDLVRDLGANVRWVRCPACTQRWAGRTMWEATALPRLARRERADALFSPAGVAVPWLRLPQIVFCQNPWALVKGLRRGPAERIKAGLQRVAYRAAVRRAAVMIFNSRYMRQAYREAAGREARRALVVYQGIDDDTHAAAARLRPERRRLQILSVSAMAPHKGGETLVRAVAALRDGHGVRADLRLVGAWPDRGYERSIRAQVRAGGLSEQVVFAGHVPRGQLHRDYAESRVFCLMSRCESFGIPAVEAQAFGTPVVGSDCCAIPEICGAGGVYPRPGDWAETARQLASLLTDDRRWSELSGKARANAQRFRWDACSRGLLEMFEGVSADGP